MKSYIKNYLAVSKREWNGLVVFIVLVALILTTPYVFKMFSKDTIINAKALDRAVALLDNAKRSGTDKSAYNAKDKSPGPAIIYKKALAGEVIELNTADSARLTALRGIGPVFAKRIIGYRNRLGGFYSKEQLKEVFGLDSEKYAALQVQVSVDASRIKKIKINQADFAALSHFPYLSFKQMNAIIQFREQHGNYESLRDMSNIAILNNEILRKIEPYLTFK